MFGASPDRLTETWVEGDPGGAAGLGPSPLGKLLDRDLKGLDLLAVFVSGIEIAQQPIVIAVGVDRRGLKLPLGVYEGRTSNRAVCNALVADLVMRGLGPDVRRLFVTDGGRAIGPAIRAAYGRSSPIQRCRVRTRRTILSRLPSSERLRIHRWLEAAWAKSDPRRAKTELKAIAGHLRAADLGGARSVLEQADETLTVTRLGLSRQLQSSLSSTSAVDRPLLLAASSTGQPIRASVMSWAAAALMKVERDGQRMRGRHDLQLLARALGRDDEPKHAVPRAAGEWVAAATMPDSRVVPGPTVIVDLAALITTLALTATVAASIRGVPRIVLALAFVTLVPGWAIVGWLTPVEATRRILLAIPVSLALGGLAATISLWIHAWQPLALFSVLAFGSMALIGWRLTNSLTPAARLKRRLGQELASSRLAITTIARWWTAR